MENMPFIFRSVFFLDLFSEIGVLIYFFYKQWIQPKLWIKIIFYSLIIAYIKGIMAIISLLLFFPSFTIFSPSPANKVGGLIDILIEEIIAGILFFILNIFTIYLFFSREWKKFLEISFWINAVYTIPLYTTQLLDITAAVKKAG